MQTERAATGHRHIADIGAAEFKRRVRPIALLVAAETAPRDLDVAGRPTEGERPCIDRHRAVICRALASRNSIRSALNDGARPADRVEIETHSISDGQCLAVDIRWSE